MASQPLTSGGEQPGRRLENLALAFQETITAIVRLRSGRLSPPSAEAFRAQVRQLLSAAEQEARARGYSNEDIRLATFAVVAFLDESILNLHLPVFADWSRKPLQEELFGGHVAGEIFFQSMQRLMERPDSHDTADTLEVFALCVALGYRGKYGVGGQAELKAVMDRVAEKIGRIRRAPRELSPYWAPPPAAPRAAATDPWLRGLLIGACAAVALAVLLFAGYKVALGSAVSELESMTAAARR
jgi:type VI secretion system protein ImpK